MLNRTFLLAFLVFMVVEGQSTTDDLPPCAALCAATAAVATGCLLDDATCLCAHPLFQNATLNCASRSCPPQDNSSANDILTKICANFSTSSSGSATSSTSVSTAQSSTTASTSASSAPMPVTSSAGASTSALSSLSSNSASISSSSSTDSTLSSSSVSIPTTSVTSLAAPQVTKSDDSSSTVIVVQTVVVGDPQTTNGVGIGSGAVRAMNLVGLGSALATLGISFAFGGWMCGVGGL